MPAPALRPVRFRPPASTMLLLLDEQCAAEIRVREAATIVRVVTARGWLLPGHLATSREAWKRWREARAAVRAATALCPAARPIVCVFKW